MTAQSDWGPAWMVYCRFTAAGAFTWDLAGYSVRDRDQNPICLRFRTSDSLPCSIPRAHMFRAQVHPDFAKIASVRHLFCQEHRLTIVVLVPPQVAFETM